MINQIRYYLPNIPIVLIGYSKGGVVNLKCAIDIYGLIDRIINVGTPHEDTFIQDIIQTIADVFKDKCKLGFLATLLIGALIGAIVASQLASDVLTNLADSDDEFKFSSWQTYVGAAAGGFIGGALTFAKIPGADAISSFATTSITIGLENITLNSDYSPEEIIKNSLFSAAIGSISGKVMNKVKINGINAGRGSYQQVSKMIITKLNAGTIRSFSVKTGFKIFVSSLYDSIPGVIFESLLQLF